MVELIPTYFINKTKNILPLDILCKRATLQTPYHAFPVSPGLNDDGASNVVEDKNEFITSESYQPCWWFSSEGEAKEGDEGCGAVHQDSCLGRRYYCGDYFWDVFAKSCRCRLPARASTPRITWRWRSRGCSRSWWGCCWWKCWLFEGTLVADLVVPRRSGWEISETKIGAETKLLPALCPVANLFSRIVFPNVLYLEVWGRTFQ